MKWLGLDSFTWVFFFGGGGLTEALYLRGVTTIRATLITLSLIIAKELIVDEVLSNRLRCKVVIKYGGDKRGWSSADVVAGIVGIAIAVLVIVI